MIFASSCKLSDIRSFSDHSVRLFWQMSTVRHGFCCMRWKCEIRWIYLCTLRWHFLWHSLGPLSCTIHAGSYAERWVCAQGNTKQPIGVYILLQEVPLQAQYSLFLCSCCLVLGWPYIALRTLMLWSCYSCRLSTARWKFTGLLR